MEVLLKGQIDGGLRKACFKVIVPSDKVNTLMVFLVTEQNPKCGIILLVNIVSEREHELAMNFVSGTGYYHLKIFGLQKKCTNKEYFEFVTCSNRRLSFEVLQSGPSVDLNFHFSLEDSGFIEFPLVGFPEDNIPIHIAQFPVSKYTIKVSGRYESKKSFLIILKPSEGKPSLFIHKGKVLEYELPFDLPPAKICNVKAIVGFTIFENGFVHAIGNELNVKTFSFKTLFTKVEYQKLYDKTMEFIKTLQGKFHSIDYLYRNKSEMYFSSINEYHNGIMKPYKKDHNGDPCSAINGRIDGLFFSTAMDFQTLKPLPRSLYGPVRLHVDASSLFTPNMNLYFADFYCHYQVHYVTVVLTPKRSPTDKFCEERLLKLDIYNNPFVYLTESKEDFYEVMVYLSNGLRVEVFYTEPINIPRLLVSHKGYFERVPIVGRGESTPGGIPKKQQCRTCNL